MSRKSISPRRRPLRLQVLEDRVVMANIVWVNEFSSTDGFTSAERAVVNAAIQAWEGIILDFDSDPNNAPKDFNLTVEGGSHSSVDLGANLGLADEWTEDAEGTPTGGRIRLDANGTLITQGFNWYVDPDPQSHLEFSDVLSPFAAEGGPAGYDMLITLLHELGHSLGFSSGYTRFAAHISEDAAGWPIYTTADGFTTRLDLIRAHLDGGEHPDDVLGPYSVEETRRLVSDVDVRILADAFGYRISETLPALGGPWVLGDRTELASQTIRIEFSYAIDPATFDTSDVEALSDAAGIDFRSHVQDVTPVPGMGNRVWDIRLGTFPAGGLRMTLGPDITSQAGMQMNQDRLWPFGDAVEDVFHFAWDDLDGPAVLGTALVMGVPFAPWGGGPASNQLLVAFDESIDVASFAPADVVLIGPSGNPIPAADINISPHSGWSFNDVPGLHNRNFLISFVPDRALPWGSYTLRIGPHVEDLFHNAMDQDGDGIRGEPADLAAGNLQDVFEWTFDRLPMVLGSREFMEDLAVRFEAFPERWAMLLGEPRLLPEDPDCPMVKSLPVYAVFDRSGLDMNDKAGTKPLHNEVVYLWLIDPILAKDLDSFRADDKESFDLASRDRFYEWLAAAGESWKN